MCLEEADAEEGVGLADLDGRWRISGVRLAGTTPQAPAGSVGDAATARRVRKSRLLAAQKMDTMGSEGFCLVLDGDFESLPGVGDSGAADDTFEEERFGAFHVDGAPLDEALWLPVPSITFWGSSAAARPCGKVDVNAEE